MYESYYATVAARKRAKESGGSYEDYIEEEMGKRGFVRDSYSGKGVWKYIKSFTFMDK